MLVLILPSFTSVQLLHLTCHRLTQLNIKQKTVAEGSRRIIVLPTGTEDGTSVKVCKALIYSTVGLCERTDTKWLNDL